MVKAWRKLEWKIRSQRWDPPAFNAIMLSNDVDDMWQELGRTEYFESLVDEIPELLQKVIDAKGNEIV